MYSVSKSTDPAAAYLAYTVDEGHVVYSSVQLLYRLRAMQELLILVLNCASNCYNTRYLILLILVTDLDF